MADVIARSFATKQSHISYCKISSYEIASLPSVARNDNYHDLLRGYKNNLLLQITD